MLKLNTVKFVEVLEDLDNQHATKTVSYSSQGLMI